MIQISHVIKIIVQINSNLHFHHRLTAVLEYTDGRNDVNINDDFLTYTTDRTDLDMEGEKIGIAYGPGSGREIEPDYPSANVDINPKIDEFRIVGPVSGTVGINSIEAGDGAIMQLLSLTLNFLRVFKV